MLCLCISEFWDCKTTLTCSTIKSTVSSRIWLGLAWKWRTIYSDSRTDVGGMRTSRTNMPLVYVHLHSRSSSPHLNHNAAVVETHHPSPSPNPISGAPMSRGSRGRVLNPSTMCYSCSLVIRFCQVVGKHRSLHCWLISVSYAWMLGLKNRLYGLPETISAGGQCFYNTHLPLNGSTRSWERVREKRRR